MQNFPGGPVVKNLSVSAADMGLISGPEDSTCCIVTKPMCCCCCCLATLVVSDSVWFCGLQPTRLPLSMGFSRQEYWSGLPCPPPGESSWPRAWIWISHVSCIGRWVLYCYSHLGSPSNTVVTWEKRVWNMSIISVLIMDWTDILDILHPIICIIKINFTCIFWLF